MSWPMIHGGAAHPLFSVRLSLRMIAPIQGCLVDRHLIGSPIATFPLGRESRALRFEPFHCLSRLSSDGAQPERRPLGIHPRVVVLVALPGQCGRAPAALADDLDVTSRRAE